jgi:hypothetical protein
MNTTTARDVIAAWDNGDVIPTVEMGGIGPGYEQCIQIAAIEILRDNLDSPLPDPAANDTDAEEWGNATLKRIDPQIGGLTGAQWGAAKTLAYRALRDGWDKMVASAPTDRKICISKAWPRV